MKKISFFALFALMFAICFLTACSKEVSYTVSFNSALGTAVESQTVKENEVAVKPADPTRDKHVFAGWTLDGVEYDFSTPVTSDITLTAKWTKYFTVKFVDAAGAEISTQEVAPGEDAVAPTTNPTKEGCTFKGWDKDFTNVQDDLVVAPKFEEDTFTVTFKVFGKVVDENTMAFYGDPIIQPVGPTVNGYEFIGWDNTVDVVTEDIVINAIYQKLTYNVEFYVGDVKIDSFSTTYNIVDGATMPTLPNNGYTFDGWYEDSTFTGSKISTLVEQYGDKKLYAKTSASTSTVLQDLVTNNLYPEVDYEVEFLIGSNVIEKFSTTYTILDGTTLPTLSGYGYTFDGWYENVELEGSPVTTLVGQYGTKQLYAKISGEFTAVVVDPTLTAKVGDDVLVGEDTYTMGIGICSTVAQAAATPHTGKLTVTVAAGTYNEDFTLTQGDITFVGPNSEVDPTGDATRNAEAVIGGMITLVPEIDNVEFVGFKFEGQAQIVAEKYVSDATSTSPTENHSNFLFKHNIVSSSLNKEQGSGFIVFLTNANEYQRNFQLISNTFTYAIEETSMFGMVYVNNAEDVVITGNIFKNIPANGIVIADAAKGLSGFNNNINNNIFENVLHSGVLVNWADPRVNSTTAVYNFNGNSFKNVGSVFGDFALKIGNSNNSSTWVGMYINNNTFDGGTGYISIGRCSTTCPVTLDGNHYVSNPVIEGNVAYIIRVINSGTTNILAAVETNAVYDFEYDSTQVSLTETAA